MSQVVKDGKVITNLPSVQEIVAYKKGRFEKLDPEYKRFDNPHIYKVGISTKLMETRDDLLNLK
jgi:nicotinate phosphoribosyltransferase